jgi:hypothetical protein
MTLQGKQDLIFLYLVRDGLGFENDRVKGIANCTKVQVPLYLTRRVSSKDSSQYHQTSALTAVILIAHHLFEDQPSMNLDAFLRNSSPSPTSCIYMQEAKVEL